MTIANGGLDNLSEHLTSPPPRSGVLRCQSDNINTLAQKIAENPAKLIAIQSHIEQQGNQQWRDVNKLIETVGLTVRVEVDGLISIGIYGGTVIAKFDNGSEYLEKKFTWTAATPQNHQLQLF